LIAHALHWFQLTEKNVRARPQGFIVSAVIRPFGLVALVVVCSVVQGAAEAHQGAIVCREEVPTAAREQLAKQLRAITGWPTLKFDARGSLRTGEDIPVDGSLTARSLLSKALSGNTALILEDASNRSDVVFSRVVPGRWQNDAFEKRPVFVVLIDFADFDHLMGDRLALEAFNVGWGVLHEIDHAMNDSIDSERLGHVGECEDHINQMRRECHLPERREYYFTFFPHAEESEFKTKLVRLAFDQKETSAKHRRYWLMWDATQVGGLPQSKQIAALR
jgi:hypothetical protein